MIPIVSPITDPFMFGVLLSLVVGWIGIILAVGAGVCGAIGAYQWGEGKKLELAKKGEGEKEFWSNQLGWTIIGVTIIASVTIIAYYVLTRIVDSKKKGEGGGDAK